MAEGPSPPLDESCRVMPNDVDDSIIEQGAIQQLLSETKVPPLLKQVDISKIRNLYDNCRDIQIVMTGVTGSGKSSLANALLGNSSKTLDTDKFTEGHELHPCTQKVAGRRSRRNHKIKLTVWDSPGLKDGTIKKQQDQYLKEIAGVMEGVGYDLSIHCIKADNRFVNGEQGRSQDLREGGAG